jgi:hypothetical protein
MSMKGLKKNIAIISQIIAIMFLTTISVSARPIGGWAHNSQGQGKSIAWDSPVGITVLVSIGVFLLLISLLVLRVVKKRRKSI